MNDSGSALTSRGRSDKGSVLTSRERSGGIKDESSSSVIKRLVVSESKSAGGGRAEP